MDTFTNELNAISSKCRFVKNPKFTGRCCIFKMSNGIACKIRFDGHTVDNFDFIRVEVFGKNGPIDTHAIFLHEVIDPHKYGANRPYLERRTRYSTVHWSSYKPDEEDYKNIAEEIDNYLCCFTDLS